MRYIQSNLIFYGFTISFHHSKEVFVCCLIVSLRCVFWVGLSIRGGGIDSPRPASQRAAALVLTAAMLTTFTAPAFAKTWYIEDGDITISASETKGTNKVSQGAEPEVEDTGTIITNREKDASSHTVTINAGNDKVEVTLDNVNIKADSGSALISKGDVTLTLKGDNHLTGGNGGSSSYGGDGITSSGSLTISGGTVTATGGDSTSSVGSGGSGIYSVSGDVTISGGTVNANGGDGKNGSGGGSGIDSSGGVTVSGGTVTANGGDSKDGDGGSGGYGISSSGVAISGGTVTANGGDGGSGSGSHGGNGIYSSSGVAISGGAVTANGGDSKDGSGGNGKDGSGGNGKDGSGGNGIYSSGGVTISSGSTVTANGGDGEDGSGGRGITSNGGVTVSGGTVNAKGGSGKNGNGGDGIRSFNPVAISGGTVNANGGNSDYSNGGDGIRSLDHVAISGGTVKSNGGSGNLSGGNGIISYDIDLSGSLELTAKAGSPNGKALSRVGSELDLNTIKDKLDPGAKVTATDADGKVIQQVSIPRPVEPEEPSSSSDSGSATPSAPASFLPGLTVTDKDGQRISYTSTQSGNTLTVCVGRFTASLRISLAALRQLRAEGIETITFQTILCSTTLSVDELLAMGGEDAEVVLTHHIRSSTLTVGGKAV